MQTFLPLPSFLESGRALDPARRRNQRNECKVILKTLLGRYPRTKKGRPGGWPHHPAVKMWKGYESALCHYALAVCEACVEDGWTAGDLTPFFREELDELGEGPAPPWLGFEPFHQSHRSNLIRKDPDYYLVKWPFTPRDLPYVWPLDKPKDPQLPLLGGTQWP